MKKVILGSAFLIAILAYAWWSSMSSQRTNAVVTTTTSAPSETTNPTATVPQTNNPTPKPSTGTYKDGTYTGSTADAFYGPLQVQAVIRNGKLADVVFLQYPSDQQHSREVSSMSMPILRQEAISAQNANVHVVSGATQTSDAFVQSLSSALALAK